MVSAALAQVAGLSARLGGEALDAARIRPCTPAYSCDLCLGIAHLYSKTVDHVTVSVGVASMRAPEGVNQRVLLAAADDALYKAQTAGRN